MGRRGSGAKARFATSDRFGALMHSLNQIYVILNMIVYILKLVIYYENTLHRKHEDIWKDCSLNFWHKSYFGVKITLYALIMTSYIHVNPPGTKASTTQSNNAGIRLTATNYSKTPSQTR